MTIFHILNIRNIIRVSKKACEFKPGFIQNLRKIHCFQSNQTSKFLTFTCLLMAMLFLQGGTANAQGVVTSESTFDIELFGANLAEQAGGAGSGIPLQVEGYSYAISQRDLDDPFGTFQTQYSIDNDGVSRHPWENQGGIPTSSSPFRDQEIASISKSVTAAAVLHLWQEQTDSIQLLSERLDDPIIDYLPANWAPSNNFSDITIRQLLTHTSGLLGQDNTTTPQTPGAVISIPGGFSGSGYIYSDLQAIAEQGFVDSIPGYWTINYAFFRVALPYMWVDMPNEELDAAANGNSVSIGNLPNGVWEMIQNDWGVDDSDLDEDNMLQIGPDQLTASVYKTYVIQHILDPADVTSPRTRTNSFPTLLYQYPAPNGVTGRNTGNQTLNAGPRGWNLSAADIERFLSAIRHDDSVLLPATRQLMDDEFLGWRPTTSFVGDLGQYYGHDGQNFRATIPGDNNATLPRNNTVAMTFPDGIQAAMFVNSQLGPQFGAAFDPNGNSNFPRVAMREAFDNAWTDVVYRGAEQTSGGGDNFELSAVATNPTNNPTRWIVLELNDSVVLQRRIDTINSLWIQGVSGDDTLTINALPDDLELDLFFDGGIGDDNVTINDLPSGVFFTIFGGAGNDTVDVNDKDFGSILSVNGGDDNDIVNLSPGDQDLDNVRGTFVYIGGEGSDFLAVNDQKDSASEKTHNGFAREYTVTLNSISRSGIGLIGQFSQLEDMTVNASNQSSLILVESTIKSMNLQLNANQGNDRIVLGTGHAADQLNSIIHVNTGHGDDDLIIDDRNSESHEEIYILDGEYFQAQTIPMVHWGQTSSPEYIRLRQSLAGTTTHVRNVLNGVVLDVQGNPGNDSLNVHGTALGSILNVGGGADDDIIRFTPESEDLSSIQGEVRTYGGNGLNDRVILDDEANPAADGRDYRVFGFTFDVSGTTFGKLIVPPNEGIETVEIRAGSGDDLFNVLTWSQTAALHAHGGSGSDQLRIAGGSTHTLDSIIGDLEYYADPLLLASVPSPDFDTLVIHDDQREGAPNYEVEVGPGMMAELTTDGFDLTHYGVEEITLNANDANNHIRVFGSSSILHKADYIMNAGGGKDVITVHAPASATVFGNGGEGNDRLLVLGNTSDDHATLAGDRIDVRPVQIIPATTAIRDETLESFFIDTQNGLDVLIVEGEIGLREEIQIQATPVQGSGWVIPSPHRRVDFRNLEDIDVRGNSGDGDQLQFDGTTEDDIFAINPVADGTTNQPFVHLLQSGGVGLLKLRDATDVRTPIIRGNDGSDNFRATIFPSGTDYSLRSIWLEAGEVPLQDHDQLIVNYNNIVFNLIQAPANSNDGTIRFDDDDDVLGIVFRDFEELSGDLSFK